MEGGIELSERLLFTIIVHCIESKPMGVGEYRALNVKIALPDGTSKSYQKYFEADIFKADFPRTWEFLGEEIIKQMVYER